MSLGELGETISTASYKLGVAVSHEAVARKVQQMAGEAFMKGNDKAAITYRNLAQDIIGWSCGEREEYDSKWRLAKEQAFATLDKLNKQVEFPTQGKGDGNES